MSEEKSILEMSKRELFEACKSLDEAIKDLEDYDPVDSDDEDQNIGAYFSCVQDFNEHYGLLIRRMFRKHKIFRVISS